MIGASDGRPMPGTARAPSRREALAALAALAAAPGRDAQEPLAPAARRFLDDVQRRAVQFFVERADATTGLVHDRASNFGPDAYDVASIAATGYGLAALPIGVARGWVRKEAALAQAGRALRFLLGMPHAHGWLYHFVDAKTGARRWGCEASTIDTALLVLGALVCGRRFRGSDVERMAERLYERLDWTWARTNGGARPDKLLVSHGWKPESGFLPHDWDHYCEHLLLYLLGLGAPRNPLPEASWDAWTRTSFEYAGIRALAAGPIFWHQMAFGYYDLRGRRDRLGYDYHASSAAATRIHRQFCRNNPTRRKGYGPHGWGINASDGPDGYRAYGVPQPEDGTLSPTGVLAAITYEPRDAVETAMRLRERLGARVWGRYGFVNAYNEDRDWFDHDVIGIDLGMALLAIENHRSGLVWRLMAGHPSTMRAFRRAELRRAVT